MTDDAQTLRDLADAIEDRGRADYPDPRQRRHLDAELETAADLRRIAGRLRRVERAAREVVEANWEACDPHGGMPLGRRIDDLEGALRGVREAGDLHD